MAELSRDGVRRSRVLRPVPAGLDRPAGHDLEPAGPGLSALCARAAGADDAAVPYDWSAFVSGVLMLTLLVAGAALLGWLAARLFLHATRSSADAPDHPRPR
jgi:hypothetical protein